MNFTQIKYFLTLSNCLNFTKAADQLYISQPALSRQIQYMEEELGVMLFIRSSKKVQMTPSAKILQREFQDIYDKYNKAVEESRNAYRGIVSDMKIGVLDGTRFGNIFKSTIQEFAQKYPNINIKIYNRSFGGLINGINNGELDLIVSISFDLEKRNHIAYKKLMPGREYIVVPKSHRLADAKEVLYSDFADDTFIMVSPEDSIESPRLIKEAFEASGIVPKIRYAPSINTEMLWVEAGLGICMLDSNNIWFDNPNVVFLKSSPRLCDGDLVVAWNTDIHNEFRNQFVDSLVKNNDYESALNHVDW